MILASHQPNFLPYPGFVYKMYCSDVFTLSNGVQFTRGGYHNYNFIDENGQKAKITIPVKSHSDRICDVMLADDWDKTKVKILKRIAQDYHRTPFFTECFSLLETVLGGTYTHLWKLNKALLVSIKEFYDIRCVFVDETDLELGYESPNEDIISICKQLGADRYLSGAGAHEYLNERMLLQHGIEVLWSRYKSEAYGSRITDGSILDMMMLKGKEIPDSWKKDKEAYHERKDI
jgi:hypothetical protein